MCRNSHWTLFSTTTCEKNAFTKTFSYENCFKTLFSTFLPKFVFFCFKNSFASHPRTNLWCDDNDLSARETIKNSHQYIRFNCLDCDNIYVAKLFSVIQGTWCSCTKNKSETKDCSKCSSNFHFKKRIFVGLI